MNISDEGYVCTRDVAIEHTCVKNSSIQVSQEQRDEFLKECGIDTVRFFNY